MPDTLGNLVKFKMKQENLSLRQAGKQAGVAHTTIDRVRNGDPLDFDTVKKISEWVGIPVSSAVDVGEMKAPMVDEVAAMFSMKTEFSEVFGKIANKIKSGELSSDILTEITAFASFRMEKLLEKPSKKK